MKRIIFCLCFGILLSVASFAQNATHVWIVRHAEKQTTDKKDDNPGLSEAGLQRAEDLKIYLSKKKIQHIFTTPYKRCEETVAPIAENFDLGVEYYKPQDTAFISKRVNQNLQGKRILIVGHSNTVMPIIEILKGYTPFKELKEDDYDFIFYLKIKGNKTKVKTAHFGKSQYSSTI